MKNLKISKFLINVTSLGQTKIRIRKPLANAEKSSLVIHSRWTSIENTQEQGYEFQSGLDAIVHPFKKVFLTFIHFSETESEEQRERGRHRI